MLAGLTLFAGTAAVGIAGFAPGAGASPPQAGAVIVNNGTYTPQSALPTECLTPDYPTVAAALSAATSAETIYVCSGTYADALPPISVSGITLEGANYPTPAYSTTSHTVRVADPETILDPSSGGISYTAGASPLTGETISGFTLPGTDAGASPVIDASAAGSGFTIQNNIIDVSNNGIAITSDGVATPAPSSISGNAFIQSTPASETGTTAAGAAIDFAGLSADKVDIGSNGFINLSGAHAAIDTTGAGTTPSACTADASSNLNVHNNEFTTDGQIGGSFPSGTSESFLNLACTSHALVSNNTVTISAVGLTTAQTPIVLAGGNSRPAVTDNTLTGNGAVSYGIALTTASLPGDNAYIGGDPIKGTGNQVSGFAYSGITVYGGSTSAGVDAYAAPAGFTITGNILTDDATATSGTPDAYAQAALAVRDDGATYGGNPNIPSGGTLTLNTFTGTPAGTICNDASLATSNTWSNNDASAATGTSSPLEICGTPETVTFASPGSQTLATGPVVVLATSQATSGTGINFASLTPSVCSVSGNAPSAGAGTATVTFLAAGYCTITAADSGDTSFASWSLNRTFSIAKVAQSIVFPTPYGSPVSASPLTVSPVAGPSGLPVTVVSNTTSVCTVSGTYGHTITLLTGGICKLTGKQAGDSYWHAAANVQVNFAVTGTTQTITFTPPATHTAADAPFTVSPTASSSLPVTVVSKTTGICTAGGTNGHTITLIAHGTCTLVGQQSGGGGYQAAPSVQVSFAVTLATQTITFTPPATHSVGDAPFAVSPTASSSLPVTVSSTTPGICTVSGNVVTLVAGGHCMLTAKRAGTPKYLVAPAVQVTFTVTKLGQAITFTNPGTQYLSSPTFVVSPTSSAIPGTAPASSIAINVATTTPTVCIVTGDLVTLVATGTCSLAATQIGNAQYTAAAKVTVSFQVYN
jgi:hypothetical protein